MASATTPPPSKTSSHSDLQIVPISNPDAAPASSGCWEAFKRALCCCFPAAQQHHHVDPHPAPISSKHLIENYGELISRTAQLLAHINLDREAPLSDVETETLARTTGFIQNHLDVLKKMIQHVKYYNDALKPQSLPQEPDALVASPPIHIDGAESEFKAEQVDVSKRNGQIEKFAERKIVIGLQEAPFQNPLSEEQIDQIITRV
ncbi:MAG: hypothetical protein JSR39_09510, partial [Verrucomicrobia bacterium]|nr:hypothetical protein [Verrucomicrobiota bacterium]